MHNQETRFGFEWGDARIERMSSDSRKGWVVLGLTTNYTNGKAIEIYISRAGKVRISDDRGEWQPPKEEKK